LRILVDIDDARTLLDDLPGVINNIVDEENKQLDLKLIEKLEEEIRSIKDKWKTK